MTRAEQTPPTNPNQSPHAPSTRAHPPTTAPPKSSNPTTPAAPPATPPPGAHHSRRVPAPRESTHSASSIKSAPIQHHRQRFVVRQLREYSLRLEAILVSWLFPRPRHGKRSSNGANRSCNQG